MVKGEIPAIFLLFVLEMSAKLWYTSKKERRWSMGIARFFGYFADILFPPSCEVCGCAVGHGERVCGECTRKFRQEMFLKCPVCGNTADRCACNELDEKIFKTRLSGRNSLSLTFYLNLRDRGEDRITEKMIFALKEREVLFDFFAEIISGAVKRLFDLSGEDIHDWILTYPPRSESKYSEFGYDQSEEIVRRMSKLLGCNMAQTLRRVGGGEQKSLNPTEREKNAEATVELIRENVVRGGKYIIFDDILTTGATMNSAARNLYFGGAAEVFPVTIAKTLYIKKGSIR